MATYNCNSRQKDGPRKLGGPGHVQQEGGNKYKNNEAEKEVRFCFVNIPLHEEDDEEHDSLRLAVYAKDEEDDTIPFAVASILKNQEGGNEEQSFKQDDSNDNVSSHPAAAAEPHPPLLARPVMDDNFPPLPIVRPEYLYVHAIKPYESSSEGSSSSSNTKSSSISWVGLEFGKHPPPRSTHTKREGEEGGGIYISKVSVVGLFYKSFLQAGDRVLAINNIGVSNSLHQVHQLIQSCPSGGNLSFCVQSPGGDPHFVLSSVQKPVRDMKVGIYFTVHGGALLITHVRRNSLFRPSLLMSGDHRCFYINGEYCDNKTTQAAADSARSADRVTIISQARAGNLATILAMDDMCPSTGTTTATTDQVMLPPWACSSNQQHPIDSEAINQRGNRLGECFFPRRNNRDRRRV